MNTILQKRIEEAAHQYIQSDAVAPENMQLAFGDFINGAKWAFQNQWISVDEALPEKNTMCFVRKETELGIIFDSDYVDYEGKWFFHSNRTSIQSMVITHWMMIPTINNEEK